MSQFEDIILRASVDGSIVRIRDVGRVEKGLKKGERVVVEGTQKVRDGILVELQEAGAPKG